MHSLARARDISACVYVNTLSISLPRWGKVDCEARRMRRLIRYSFSSASEKIFPKLILKLLYLDYKQGGNQAKAFAFDIDSNKYLTNATKNTSENESDNKSHLHRDYWETIGGYTGVSGSKLLKEYRDAIINVDMMVINALAELFFMLW